MATNTYPCKSSSDEKCAYTITYVRTPVLSVTRIPSLAGTNAAAKMESRRVFLETLAIDGGRFELALQTIGGSVTKLRVEISADLDSDTQLNVLRNVSVPMLARIGSPAPR